MNKVIKYSLIGTALGFGLFLGSCEITPPTIVGISLAGDLPQEFLINEFDYEDFNINVLYSNNTSVEIPLTEEMLNTVEYLDAIKKEGEHTLTITYRDFECQYSFTVKKYEFQDIYVEEQTVVYDGEYHSLVVKGNIPQNTNIEFIDKNSYKNAGEYTITARLANEYYKTKTITGTLKIEKASFDYDKIKFDDVECVYDGKAHEVEVTGVDSSVKVTYKIGNDETNKAVDAGVYTVVAHFESSLNYNQIPNMTATLTIKKADYNMDAYTFADKSVYYTGDKVEMHINNEQSLPEGVTVTYVGLNEAINAGSYEIIARFNGESNYNDIPDKKATLTIKPAIVGLTGVYLDSMSVVYDGKEHGIEYSGSKPNSIVLNKYAIYNQKGDLVYDSSSLDSKYRRKPVDAGNYAVYAYFSYRDNKNYDEIEPLSATLIITKADITDIVIENETKEYIPGMGQSLTIKTGLNGIIATPSIANPVDPGDYLITYSFSLTDELAKNYNVPEPITRTLSITKRNIFADKTTQNKYSVVYDGKLHGIDINLSVDETKWIQPYFFYYNENQEEVPFTGFSEPGTYLIFMNFTILDGHPENYQDYYYIPSRASAYLTIQKKQIEFDESWLSNRMSIYDGATVTVKLNETDIIEGTGKTGLENMLSKNLGLGASDFVITYTDNVATDVDYYTGSLNIEVVSAKEKYFDNLYNFEFHYAIKKASGGEEIYPTVVQKTFTYDGKSHSIELSNLPEGISLRYEGDTNELTLPGSKDIIILFHCDNDVAKWYYEFPSLQVSTISGDPQLILQLTVLHIDFYPEIETPTYTYELGCENREVYVKRSIAGVEVSFVYDEDERVDVGTYGVVVQVEITSAELLKIYNPTNAFRVYFKIVPTDYKFSFTGLNAIYDGKKHNINVVGIEKEVELGYISYTIEDKDGNIIDGYSEVGTYNVYIKFTNNSINYKDVPNQSLQLVIETSKVKTQDLIDYIKTTTYGRTTQLESVYSFLNTIIDTTPFEVEYKIDYYIAAENPQYPTDPLFHGQGTTEDFVFTQYTTDTGFALLEFNLTFKNGYESKDGGFTDSYHGFIRIKVNEINKYDLSTLFNQLRYDHSITQGKTLDEEYLNVISSLNYSYTCEYVDGTEPYDDRYENKQGTSEDDNPFCFLYNTYGDRKVKVTLTIPENENFIFYDGIHSLLSINETFYLDVELKDCIDIYETVDELKKLTSMDRLANYDLFVEDYYNDDIYDLTYSIKDNNGVEYSNKDSLGLMKVAGDFVVYYQLTAKSGCHFIINYDTSYEFNVPLKVNDVSIIYVQDFIDSLDNVGTTLYQYGSIYRDIADKLVYPEGLKVSFTLVDCNDKQISAVMNDLYGLKATDGFDSNYVFYSYDTSIPNNRVLLYLTLTPYEDGYALLDKDSNDATIYGKQLVLDPISYQYKQRTLIEYYYIYNSVKNVIENNGSCFTQYSRIGEYFQWLLDNKKYNYGNESLVKISFSIKYYGNGFEEELCSTWDDLDNLIPAYNNYSSTDKIKMICTMQVVDDDVVITANPNIIEKTFRNIEWAMYPVKQITVDSNLTNRINALTTAANPLEYEQYSEVGELISNSIGSYAATNGPTIENYSVELINKTTNKADAVFGKVTKTLDDEYRILTKNDSNQYYRITVKFKNSITADSYLLDSNGVLVTNPEYQFKVTVIDNPNVFLKGDEENFIVPTYTQFEYVVDYLNEVTHSPLLKITSWEITIPGANGNKSSYKYSGNMNSSTRISKQFNEDPLYESNGKIKISYERANSSVVILDGNKLYDSDVLTYEYDLNINYLKNIDLYQFKFFCDSGKLYVLTGQTPMDYFNFFYKDVEGLKITITSATYSTSEYNHTMTATTVFPDDAIWARVYYQFECLDGYYFETYNGSPVTAKTFNINKAVKTPIEVDVSQLVNYAGHGINATADTYNASLIGFTQDYIKGAKFTYKVDGVKQSTNHLNDIVVNKPDNDFQISVVIDWELTYDSANAKSTQALKIIRNSNDCPIGFQDTIYWVINSSSFNILFDD